MFQAILSQDVPRLQQLGLKFHLEDNKPAALLCLDHVYSYPFGFQETTFEETISALEIFHAYASLLHDVAFTPEPCREGIIQRLFAFSPEREDRFLVHKGTFLYNAIAKQEVQFSEANHDIQLVSQTELSQAFKNSVSERLRRRVMEENEVCRSAKIFSPCLYALEGSCQRSTSECPRIHVDPARLNQKWYNDRVRIHLQQILIFQTLHSVYLEERWWQQRYMINLNMFSLD